jgi:hypothetical protein
VTAFVISPELRNFVRQRAGYRCEYCQTHERISGIACEIDHIVPIKSGGESVPDNLCLACSACNGRKWAKTEGTDPQTGEGVALYNPRQQSWHEHFAWDADGRYLLGLTPCGRATIDVLQMNHELIVAARSIWAQFGLHPH